MSRAAVPPNTARGHGQVAPIEGYDDPVFLIVGAAPSLFLLLFFYLKDRYEPEPRGHVALAFAKGALCSVPVYFAAGYIEHAVGRDWLALGGLPARLFEAGVIAAGVEEA